MGIISWILFGLTIGIIGKLISPGRDPGGLVVTALIGIAGGVIGGFIGTSLGWGDVNGFDLRSMGLAIVGTCILLFGYRKIRG